MSCDVCARSSCTACSTSRPAGGGGAKVATSSNWSIAAGSDGFSVKPSPFCRARVSWAAMRSTRRSKCVRSRGSTLAPSGASSRTSSDLSKAARACSRCPSDNSRSPRLKRRSASVSKRRRRIDRRRWGRGRDRRRGGGGLNRRRDLRCRVAAACRRNQEDCNGQPERSSHLGAPLPDRTAPMCLRPAGGSYRGVGAGQVLPAGRNLRTKLGSGNPDMNPSPWIEIRPSGGPAEGSTPRGVRSRRQRDVFAGRYSPTNKSFESPSSRAAGVTIARAARRMRRPARRACRTSSSQTKSTAWPGVLHLDRGRAAR